jgi:hypothetical protein
LVRLKTRVVLKVLLQQLQNVTLIDEYDKKPLEPVDAQLMKVQEAISVSTQNPSEERSISLD